MPIAGTSVSLLFLVTLCVLTKFTDGQSFSESETIGPCVNGKCPSKFYCRSDYQCYPDGWKPLGKLIGSCINNLCPANHICQNGYCVKLEKEDLKTAPIGPCVNGVCPTGFECRNNECIAS